MSMALVVEDDEVQDSSFQSFLFRGWKLDHADAAFLPLHHSNSPTSDAVDWIRR